MQTYVDKLNGSVEGLNLSYDEQTDSLNQTTDAIYKKIEAHKQEAIAAAYTKMAEEAQKYMEENNTLFTDLMDKHNIDSLVFRIK